MEVSCTYTDAVFSPAEVHEMTTMAPQHQRVWRQRGFLGERKYGRASFTAREVAQIMALRYLGQDLKLDLEFVREAVSKAAPIILWHALADPKAWKVEGATPEHEAAFYQAIDAENLFGLHYLDKMVGVKRDSVGQFLVITPRYEGICDLADIFHGDRLLGAVVLDLIGAGKELRDNAKRPLIIVSDIEILSEQQPSSRTARGARATRR